MSDGLTVPFALPPASRAPGSSHLVVTAGLAEVAAGSIAMGLGGYLEARGEAELYQREREGRRPRWVEQTAIERAEVVGIRGTHGMDDAAGTAVVPAPKRQPSRWVDCMTRFELGLERPTPRRALAARQGSVAPTLSAACPPAALHAHRQGGDSAAGIDRLHACRYQVARLSPTRMLTIDFPALEKQGLLRQRDRRASAEAHGPSAGRSPAEPRRRRLPDQ
jgi:hypothetical protein